MRRIRLCMLGILGTLMLIGCGAHAKKGIQTKAHTPENVVSRELEVQSHGGSLWRPHSTMASLYSDPKARKVGDIVTISIVESSSATESADTDTGRESSVKAGVDTFLGYENRLMKKYTNFNSAEMLDASLSNEFKGSGKTVRSGKLTASITARVIEVLPSGNLVIEGRREVEVNHETQYIVISGIVRPEDISRDNTVLSTFLSDARIAYSGRGIINDHQKPGWFTGLVNRVWPF